MSFVVRPLFVADCPLCVACCVLFAVGCGSLCVVRCALLLFVVWCVLHGVRYTLSVFCCLWLDSLLFAVCSLCGACCLLRVVCYVLFAACCVLVCCCCLLRGYALQLFAV